MSENLNKIYDYVTHYELDELGGWSNRPKVFSVLFIITSTWTAFQKSFINCQYSLNKIGHRDHYTNLTAQKIKVIKNFTIF
jgi:hypothetical protein